jgi:hypothetical protein
LFLAAGLVVAIVEFCVLLSIIFNCTKLSEAVVHRVNRTTIPLPSKNLGMTRDRHILHSVGDNSSSPASTADVREIYVQPKSLEKPKYAIPFKPSQHYQVSKSYLV